MFLQDLGADEFGPAADLRGNTLSTGQLGVHGGGEEEGSLEIDVSECDQRLI